MAARTLPPFRADHVGSLLRPPDLLDARARHRAGELDDDGLREVEDAAIRDVVALQREAGLRTATDGEFRRTSWHMDFIYQLEGVDPTDQKLAVHFHNKSGDLDFESAALSVHDRIGLGHTIFGDAFEFLQTVAEGDQVPKLTIPSPNMVHYRGGRAAIDESVYPDLEPFWADLTAAYAEQVRRVAELGCTYLQLDDTSLAYLNDPEQRALVASQGGDPDHLHEQYVAERQRRDRRPARLPARDDAHVPRQLPVARGRPRAATTSSPRCCSATLDVDGFFLEYDDERSGGFEPLRFVPEGKQVVLGLVTTKTGELEDKDDLKRRIDEASKYVPLEQLCLSPQCGFSSTVEGNELTVEQERAKLRLVVETAEEVWG